MSDLAQRARETAAKRKAAEPWDDPQHYLNVVARISREDGALMNELADRIDDLERVIRWVRGNPGAHWHTVVEVADSALARIAAEKEGRG